MRKLPAPLLLAGLLGASIAAHAQTPGPAAAAPEPAPSPFTGKVALYSEYEYRGISQTSEKPAVQLNLDYAHSSGLYIGTFLSNIKWLKDIADTSGFSTGARVEWDIYGGYKWEFIKDWTLDVGYLRYEYPSSGAFNPKPNTDEIYVGVSYGPATLKYSYSMNDTFGIPQSDGSDYIELTVNQPLEMVAGLTLNGTLGHQRYTGTQPNGFKNNDLSYGVWKAGATYDFGKGLNVGAYVKGTTAKNELYTVKDKDWSKTRLVAFVTYSF